MDDATEINEEVGFSWGSTRPSGTRRPFHGFVYSVAPRGAPDRLPDWDGSAHEHYLGSSTIPLDTTTPYQVPNLKALSLSTLRQ